MMEHKLEDYLIESTSLRGRELKLWKVMTNMKPTQSRPPRELKCCVSLRADILYSRRPPREVVS